MKSVASAAAFAAAMGFAGLSHAGGLPEVSKKDDPVVYHSPTVWTGFYVGGHIGGGWGDSEVVREDGPPGPPGFDIDTDPSGAIFGAQIGYNFQKGHAVFGVVADISGSAIDGDDEKDGGGGPPAAFETEYDWLATVRARFGYLTSSEALLYVHGGFAAADLGFKGIGGQGPWKDVESEDTETGWTAGAGLEYAISPDVTLFTEYSYMDFGDQSITPDGPPGDIEQESQLHVVKFGFNVRVGHPAADTLK